jgi:hypothetical protein
MPNDWTKKSLKDIVSNYAADIEADKVADDVKRRESERIAREQKETEKDRRAAEEHEIRKFVNLVAPVFVGIRDQLHASKIDANIVNWWVDKHNEDRALNIPGSKPRILEKLIELTFANHPKDRIKESYILFCAGKCEMWPPDHKITSPENARDAYILLAGTGTTNDRPAHNMKRLKEMPFVAAGNWRAPTAEDVEWIIKEAFANLGNDSAKRRGN